MEMNMKELPLSFYFLTPACSFASVQDFMFTASLPNWPLIAHIQFCCIPPADRVQPFTSGGQSCLPWPPIDCCPFGLLAQWQIPLSVHYSCFHGEPNRTTGVVARPLIIFSRNPDKSPLFSPESQHNGQPPLLAFFYLCRLQSVSLKPVGEGCGDHILQYYDKVIFPNFSKQIIYRENFSYHMLNRMLKQRDYAQPQIRKPWSSQEN